jgi:hypothetical protein
MYGDMGQTSGPSECLGSRSRYKYKPYTETKKTNRSGNTSVGKVVRYKLMQNTHAHNLDQENMEKNGF